MSDRIKNIVVTVSFLFVIVVIFISNILKDEIDISQAERRKLAKFPDVTISSLLSGEFANDFEDYTMDQFVKRDEFRTLKTLSELNLFLKTDSNQIYEYGDYLVKQEYPLNEKSVINLTKKINLIKEEYLDESNNIYFSIVPDKNYYVENDNYLKLDYKKIENIMTKNLDRIKYIDITNELELDDYYFTDTHWKQENLLNVLNKISNEMNFSHRIKTTFIKKKITGFKGVYAGQLPVKVKEDTINILTNNIIEESTVYNYETKEYTDVYDMTKLKGSFDKYDIYLSGATPLLELTNNNSKTDKKLIVFRDSFGSSLIPLFTEAYNKIIVVDTRYISSSLLNNYIDFKEADVLFIYSTLIINNSNTLK